MAVDFPKSPAIWGLVAFFRSFSRRGMQAIPVLILLFLACATPMVEQPFPERVEKARTIFVVDYGWHAAIVTKKSDVSERALPEIRDFAQADYLEFGWGDWDYYQAPDPGLGLALKAAFWPTASVVRVAGFMGPVKNYFSGGNVVEITVTDEAFQRLIEFISGTFARPDPGAPAEARPGLEPNSRFYPAKGTFHLLRTCNTWVAEALGTAGLPISSAFVVTTGSLMRQVRPFDVAKKDS